MASVAHKVRFSLAAKPRTAYVDWSSPHATTRRRPFRGTYTILLSAVLFINLCLLTGHISGDLFRIPELPGFLASVNLFTAVLVRNELFLNALYRVLIKCCSPAQIPVAIKHTVTSSLLHIGGIHAGCAAASLIWLSFGMFSSLSQDAADKKHWALFLLLSGIIMLLAIMCITAAPMVRSRYHDLFEFVHRFFGWCALLLMWMMLLLTTSWGPRSDGSGSQLSATECISFGLAASITALILAPWLTVRKVTVHTRIPSRSVIEIKFAGSSGPGMFGRISRHALADWHAFALVPGGRGAPSHSMVISGIGDFTRGLITGPPEKLYVRAIKFAGLPSCVLMYQRAIIIATGAGMAPYLAAGSLPRKASAYLGRTGISRMLRRRLLRDRFRVAGLGSDRYHQGWARRLASAGCGELQELRSRCSIRRKQPRRHSADCGRLP